jgi:hypothetical protein
MAAPRPHRTTSDRANGHLPVESRPAEGYEASTLQKETMSKADFRWQDRFLQQQFRLQRGYLKALKDLRALQKERPAQPQPLAEPAPAEDMQDAQQNLTEESQSPAPPGVAHLPAGVESER